MVKRSLLVPVFLVFCLLVFFLPFLLNPNLLLNRSNDLAWFSQSYNFFKDQLLNHHFFPLWQNYTLSGSPYLGDPQNPLLYLPNYLVLLLPLETFYMVFILSHFLLGAWGMTYFAKKLNFSTLAALFSGIVYSYSPIFSAHLTEGHLNMLAAFAWVPFFLAGVYNLTTKPRFFFSLLTSLAAAAIFLNYLTIFVYALLAGLVLIVLQFPKNKRPTLVYSLWAVSIFGVITSPQIITSLIYFPLTTRKLISIEDIYPQVVSIRRFLQAIILPYSYDLKSLGAESILTAGIISQLLGFLGLVFIKPKYKLLILCYLILAFFLALNLKVPGYAWMVTTFPIFLIFRIATRFWFITIIIISLLGGYFLTSKVPGKFHFLLCFLVIIESSFFNWKNFESKPSVQTTDQNFEILLSPILKEDGYFRIYCTGGCPGLKYLPNKGLANGYNPVQLINYFNYIAPASGYRFGSYAVSLPPYQVLGDKPQPSGQALSLLSVKYIFSTYELTDQDLKLRASKNSWLVYENQKYTPRTFTTDQPGKITMRLDPKVNQVYVSEVYMPLWRAFDQDNNPLPITSFGGVTMTIPTTNVTKLTLTFGPPWLIYLVALSLLSSTAAYCYLVIKLKLMRFRIY